MNTKTAARIPQLAAGLQNFNSSADAANLKSKKESQPATPAAAGRCHSGVFSPCKNYKSVQVRVKVSYLVSI